MTRYLTPLAASDLLPVARLTRVALLTLAASWTVAPLAGWLIGWLA